MDGRTNKRMNARTFAMTPAPGSCSATQLGVSYDSQLGRAKNMVFSREKHVQQAADSPRVRLLNCAITKLEGRQFTLNSLNNDVESWPTWRAGTSTSLHIQPKWA